MENLIENNSIDENDNSEQYEEAENYDSNGK